MNLLFATLINICIKLIYFYILKSEITTLIYQKEVFRLIDECIEMGPSLLQKDVECISFTIFFIITNTFPISQPEK